MMTVRWTGVVDRSRNHLCRSDRYTVGLVTDIRAHRTFVDFFYSLQVMLGRLLLKLVIYTSIGITALNYVIK